MQRVRIIVFILVFLMADYAFASEAAYAPVRRFLPLRPPFTNSNSTHNFAAPPAKFFPLAQVRAAMPVRNETKNTPTKDSIIHKQDNELPNQPKGIISGNNANMSQEQAQQILSIFSEKQ